MILARTGPSVCCTPGPPNQARMHTKTRRCQYRPHRCRFLRSCTVAPGCNRLGRASWLVGEWGQAWHDDHARAAFRYRRPAQASRSQCRSASAPEDAVMSTQQLHSPHPLCHRNTHHTLQVPAAAPAAAPKDTSHRLHTAGASTLVWCCTCSRGPIYQKKGRICGWRAQALPGLSVGASASRQGRERGQEGMAQWRSYRCHSLPVPTSL